MFTIIWLVFRFFDPLELDVRERDTTRDSHSDFRVECAVMRVSMYSIFFTQLLADNVSKGKSENRGQSESNTTRKWFKKLLCPKKPRVHSGRARVHDYRTLRVITNQLLVLRKRFFALSTHPVPSRNRALGLSSKPWSASLSTMKKQSASSTLSPIRRFVKHCF